MQNDTVSMLVEQYRRLEPEIVGPGDRGRTEISLLFAKNSTRGHGHLAAALPHTVKMDTLRATLDCLLAKFDCKYVFYSPRSYEQQTVRLLGCRHKQSRLILSSSPSTNLAKLQGDSDRLSSFSSCRYPSEDESVPSNKQPVDLSLIVIMSPHGYCRCVERL